jgi:P2 family phage contractile tail tube protein
MALPYIMKNFNIFVDGGSFLGIGMEYTEPKLVIKTESLRNGGMLGEIMIDVGLEALEAEFTMAGHVKALQRKFGESDIEGTRLRFVGAYQRDDGSRAESAEVYLGGRFTEIDMGTGKAGDKTEHKYKVAVNYYRRVVDGRTEIEISMADGLFIVDGVDRYQDITSIITS